MKMYRFRATSSWADNGLLRAGKVAGSGSAKALKEVVRWPHAVHLTSVVRQVPPPLHLDSCGPIMAGVGRVARILFTRIASEQVRTVELVVNAAVNLPSTPSRPGSRSATAPGRRT